MPDGTQSNEPKFRIQVEVVGGRIHAVDNQPADVVEECVRLFVRRRGSGLTLITPDGQISWGWDEIRSVGAIRMVALIDIEMQPRLVWTPSVPDTHSPTGESRQP